MPLLLTQGAYDSDYSEYIVLAHSTCTGYMYILGLCTRSSEVAWVCIWHTSTTYARVLLCIELRTSKAQSVVQALGVPGTRTSTMYHDVYRTFGSIAMYTSAFALYTQSQFSWMLNPPSSPYCSSCMTMWFGLNIVGGCVPHIIRCVLPRFCRWFLHRTANPHSSQYLVANFTARWDSDNKLQYWFTPFARGLFQRHRWDSSDISLRWQPAIARWWRGDTFCWQPTGTRLPGRFKIKKQILLQNGQNKTNALASEEFHAALWPDTTSHAAIAFRHQNVWLLFGVLLNYTHSRPGTYVLMVLRWS
jgi:hypothetical protein